MAETKILNLDAFLAEQPERVVTLFGAEHPVAGLTGATYLKFLQKRGLLAKAEAKSDEAAQWDLNIEIIGLLIPTLAGTREKLLALKLPALMKLVEFVLAEMQPEGQAGQATAEPPGESMSPA